MPPKNTIEDSVMKIHAAVITFIITGLLGWVWVTNADMEVTKSRVNEHEKIVAVIPEIREDMRELKVMQSVALERQRESAEILKELAREKNQHE